MKFVPHPFQETMIRQMVDAPRVNLWARMGAGKTVVVLTGLDRLSLVEDVYPVLVVATKRVAMFTWAGESKKWDHLQHLRVATIVGTAEQRRAAMRTTAEIYCTNYENLVWLIEELNGDWPYRTVVADESTRLKSLRVSMQKHKKTGKVFLAGQGGTRAKKMAKVAHRSPRWINLTGTPASNGVKDVWPQQWFIDRGERLGNTYSKFKEWWFSVGYDGQTLIPHPHSQGEIEERIRDVTLSINPADYIKLPPLIEVPVVVKLPRHVRQIYRDVERKFFAELKSGSVIEANFAAARSTKCLQITAGAVYLTEDGPKSASAPWEPLHDEKLDALESIVEEANGAPVLVAYHFKPELQRILTRFGKSARALDTKAQTIADWNAGRIPILCAHPMSAGHGLNLQEGGSIIVMMTTWWDLELDEQILERIGPTRQAQAGLNRKVYRYRIIAEDTIDEDVTARIASKATVQDSLMKAMERRA